MFNYKSCLYHYWNKTESNINFFEPFFCGARHFQDWTFVVFGVVDKYNCSRMRRLLVVCSWIDICLKAIWHSSVNILFSQKYFTSKPHSIYQWRIFPSLCTAWGDGVAAHRLIFVLLWDLMERRQRGQHVCLLSISIAISRRLNLNFSKDNMRPDPYACSLLRVQIIIRDFKIRDATAVRRDRK